MSGSLTQPTHQQSLPRAETGGQQYRSATCWPAQAVPPNLLATYPGAGLYVPGAYASVWDLVDTSLPQDSRHDFNASEMQRWLLIGAGKINEHLGQRGWNVPLVWWSETVVWANAELAYIGLARKRGINTEGDAQNFRDRDADVKEWLRAARDREITPDLRESDADLGAQAFRYVGPPARGWDAPAGYLGRGGRYRY